METRESFLNKNSIYTLFFSVLVFLCCADRFFAFRVDNYNLRIGQFFLLAAIISIAYLIHSKKTFYTRFFKIIKNWIPFFLAYTAAAALSPDSKHTFLKLLWALFNMGGAALLFLGVQRWDNLKKGVCYGISAVAILIWIQFILLYCFGLSNWFNFLLITAPANIPWFHKLLGFAQSPGTFLGIPIFRPHAFYYEPSYAGCALSFAFPLCLSVIYKNEVLNWKTTLIPALIFGAVFITSARSGILGICLGTSVAIVFSFLKKEINLLKSFFKILIITLLLFAVLSPFWRVQKFAVFFANDLGPNAVADRIDNPQSSEGWRLANIIHGLKTWAAHPILGEGVPPTPSYNKGLGLTCENMWIEVLVECGTLGFLAFLFGIGKSLLDSIGKKTDLSQIILITAALTTHFLVNMNFTSTFPRLDYWLLFFFAVRLAFENQNHKTSNSDI